MPDQEIEGNIWLAGADPDAMILGVSFVSRGSIYMNTLHIAYPDRRQISEIEPGLIIITEPMRYGGELGNEKYKSPAQQGRAPDRQ